MIGGDCLHSPDSWLPVNPYPVKLIYLNFHPPEVVARYRDPQLQVGENYSYLFILSTAICQFWCSDTYFIANNSDWSTYKRD